MRITALAALLATLFFAHSPAAAWTAQEVEEPYAVTGRTGIEPVSYTHLRAHET